ncbi:hypothetical protein PYCCODRAFT_1426395 [Trametes coccinea BRFM310]|uniref:Uncharacterized protein n=1 Tax=Trametes coccinea (strain BRFM310) TaxID=1353009 RepID=A0A1Y2IH97_TRAC3|nr:hypothetical protein PYCCODRAFT_1426395 [Trametes coccinea BRFM310]
MEGVTSLSITLKSEVNTLEVWNRQEYVRVGGEEFDFASLLQTTTHFLPTTTTNTTTNNTMSGTPMTITEKLAAAKVELADLERLVEEERKKAEEEVRRKAKEEVRRKAEEHQKMVEAESAAKANPLKRKSALDSEYKDGEDNKAEDKGEEAKKLLKPSLGRRSVQHQVSLLEYKKQNTRTMKTSAHAQREIDKSKEVVRISKTKYNGNYQHIMVLRVLNYYYWAKAKKDRADKAAHRICMDFRRTIKGYGVYAQLWRDTAACSNGGKRAYTLKTAAMWEGMKEWCAVQYEVLRRAEVAANVLDQTRSLLPYLEQLVDGVRPYLPILAHLKMEVPTDLRNAPETSSSINLIWRGVAFNGQTLLTVL